MGMVMTLVIVVDEDDADDAHEGRASAASHEHPARVLGVILGDGRGAPQRQRPGRHRRRLDRRDRADPAQAARWSSTPSRWCCRCCCPTPRSPSGGRPTPPDDPAADPLGALAQRRITDAAAVDARQAAGDRTTQCAAYAPGNTDLAWTRLTPWRALLAAALDQHPLQGHRRRRSTAERISPSADLLVAWLADRLKVDGRPRTTPTGPGITEVVHGDQGGRRSGSSRADGRLATFTSPGRPDRPVALKRRELPELLAEELRRLDEDDVYAATAPARCVQGSRPEPSSVDARSAHRGPRRTPPTLATAVAGELLEPARRDAQAARRGARRSGSPAAPSPRRVHREVARLRAGAPRSTGRGWSFWWGDERFVAARLRRPQRRPGARGVPRRASASTRPTCTRCPSTDDGRRRRRRPRRRTPTSVREHGAGAFEVLMLGVGPGRPRRVAVPRAPRSSTSTTRSPSRVTDSPKPPPGAGHA